jgi:hypothetical protein
MIEHLPEREQQWLERFFAAPNELGWSSLLDGSASAREADQVWQWLRLLAAQRPGVPLVLPFVRGGTITGWYATTRGPSGGYELGDEINAWLGPTWLSRFERVPESSSDPMAEALRDRFGGTVYRFTGPDDAALQAISARLKGFAALLERKPLITRTQARPVGAIRSDFERALLAGDETQAEAMIAELKQTGRLNEENLRYLDVRLSAGLGLWPQIARDHWLIKTMADLALPPQVLADLIEALYRTYVDEVEASGDAAAMQNAFARHIATPYPKLFASRRGIRASRVVKAFLLFEDLQARPDPAIIEDLLDLLPPGTDASLFEAPRPAGPAPRAAGVTISDEADEAFDDGRFDRAFEFYLRLAPSRKTISRLVSCVGTIATDDARNRLLALVDQAKPDLLAGLAPGIASKIESLRQAQPSEPSPVLDTSVRPSANLWMNWAERLQTGHDLAAAERDIQSAPTNWDTSEFGESGPLAQRFATVIGGLAGEAGSIARAAVPQIFASFFPADTAPSPTTKPIASLLFLLIAMDEALSRTDLDLLAQLTSILIEQGLSFEDYVTLIRDLEDVQKRIGSYAYLPWSLDLSEALAILPCASDAARDARLRLFLQVLGQAAGFAHRLAPIDLVPIEILAKDYGVSPEAVSALRRDVEAEEAEPVLPNLEGKTIGIYTLAEAAGSRAKVALEKLFPGCKVVVNSDLVATPQLASLAKGADMFVFAWKSSSHQAFYCVKDALTKGEPIWAPGKGTASILRAVLDHLA